MVYNTSTDKGAPVASAPLIGKLFASNQMEQASDGTIMFFIMIGVRFFETVIGIASVLRKGVLKDQRVLLMKKTNAELRSMLHGVNKT